MTFWKVDKSAPGKDSGRTDAWKILRGWFCIILNVISHLGKTLFPDPLNLLVGTSVDSKWHPKGPRTILGKTIFCVIFEIGWRDGARWGLEGTRAILTDKTHANVRVTPISLQSGEPRTLKHCKNTYKMSVNFRSGARCTLYRPLIHRQDPYRINLFGE